MSGAKLTSLVSKLPTLFNGLLQRLEPLSYQTKVAMEVGKLVFKDRPLPTLSTFPEFQLQLQSLKHSIQQGHYKQWKMNEVMKGMVLTGEALTFFILGEMIGRRSIIGYKV
ncbi:hypothetical protein HMI54_004243 [Coelomomyces lativittatus]|nr:hypothetical protein HMI54_004243 [Coelomomyces lativittatus]KAJ1508383.1 hypothetical protein HMI55_000397 [Coelomomyces lativittatus]KAJ1512898.1 hypothetical protein HMI56_003359 [Coelomomyces lativittatus]